MEGKKEGTLLNPRGRIKLKIPLRKGSFVECPNFPKNHGLKGLNGSNWP